MKNTVNIKSDGINVYVTSIVNAHIAGKIILTVMNLAVLCLYVYFITTIEEKEVGKFVLPIVLMFVVFIYFPWRYWFWNFFGKENVIINTKTITYFNDYGLIVTKPKTVHHHQLKTSYESVREFDGEDFGKLIFWSYDLTTNLPEQIYQTSVLISKTDIQRIGQNIFKVYTNEFKDRNLFTFSEN